MSIADHFEQASDASYMRDYSSSSARRQWNMSLMLLGLFLVASVAIGLILRFDQSSAAVSDQGASTSVAQTVAPPSYVGKL